MENLFYLTPADLWHYDYMLRRGYHRIVVPVGSQKFVVFQLVDKPVFIAWPSASGQIDWIPQGNLVFEASPWFQSFVKPHLAGRNAKCVLFPKMQ